MNNSLIDELIDGVTSHALAWLAVMLVIAHTHMHDNSDRQQLMY